MLPYREFYNRYGHKYAARKKYKAALTKALSFGGFVSFGNVHHTVLPGQANIHGYVNIFHMAECDLDESLRSQLVPRATARAWQEMFSTMMDEMAIDGALDHARIFTNYIKAFEEAIESYTSERLTEQLFGVHLDMTVKTVEEYGNGENDTLPVFIREGCFSTPSALPNQCSEVHKYFYYGACGVRIQPIIHYLSSTSPFAGLYPYSYGTLTGMDRFPCKKHIIEFLTHERYKIMIYSVNIDGVAMHQSHARFAVKDVSSRRVFLFDPQGDFYMEGTRDLDFFSTTLQQLRDGLSATVVDGDASIIWFNGFEGKRVSDSWENTHPVRPLAPDGTYRPILSVDNVVRAQYKGDQPPSEGSCALASLTRALFILLHPELDLGRALNHELDCKIPIFVSLLAQSFGDQVFNYANMDEHTRMKTVIIQIPGETDRQVCVSPHDSNFTMTMYQALLRANYSMGLDLRHVNPYMYDVYYMDRLLYPNEVFDALLCYECPAPCIRLVHLADNMYNVPFFRKHTDTRASKVTYSQVGLHVESTGRVRDIFKEIRIDARTRSGYPPIHERTHELVYMLIPTGVLLDPSRSLREQHYFVEHFPRPEVCMVYKSRTIRANGMTVEVNATTTAADVIRSCNVPGTTQLVQAGQIIPNGALIYSTFTEDVYELH